METPSIPQNTDQVVGLIRKFAPPLVGLSIGFGAGDILGLGALIESFIVKYIPNVTADIADKIASIAVVGAYLALWMGLRHSGMIGRAIGWAGFGVAIREVIALKEAVI